jgi:hypothetical protein
MNISSNPWSFTSADVVAAVTPTASPNGLVQSGAPALGTVTLTTTGAHGLSAGQYVMILGTTNGRFVGLYKVAGIVSATVALLTNISSPANGQPFSTVLAGDGGGSVFVNTVQQMVRAEDMSIQATSSTPTAGLLLVSDRNGNIVWEAQLPSTAPTGSQNRGKVMWVDGLTLQSIPAGWVLLVTIN